MGNRSRDSSRNVTYLGPDIKAIFEAAMSNDDLFNLNYSGYDVVFFWFNLSPELVTLMDKLYNELRKRSKVVCLHSSRRQWRDGIYVPEESYPLIPCTWQPNSFGEVEGNRFYLYTR